MGGKTLEGMADGLVEETLVEAASTFFGSRKALEEEIELYQRRVAELGRVQQEVLRRAAALHSLLPGPDAVGGFYAAIGVAPGRLPAAAAQAAPARLGVRAPLALLPWRRYAGLLLAAYAALVDAAGAYLHGRHCDGPEGRKVQTVNLDQLNEWCRSLNERIQALNRDQRPSGTMSFVRGLDPAGQERSRLADAPLDGYASGLDRDLAFAPVQCPDAEALAVPELPSAHKVRGAVLGHARAVWAADPAAARARARAFARGAKGR
ncbi:hypothetical protein [Desulfocurvus vexinensis]|uniref:hypothetical protein n=1 Tax=Desulfocurvus vexinensis TaxID=399548 RepID=UPI00048AFA58|nr:hypothetical protein [Desulfocurvus vexinensis]